VQNYAATIRRDGLGFGEAPRWHEGRLWYADFYRHAVFSMDPLGHEERQELAVPQQPSGLGWLPDGSLLVVSMIDHLILRWHNEELTTFADISAYCGYWANDMVVSASGQSYVGNFGFDLDTLLRDHGVEGLLASPPPTTNLVVLDANGEVLQSVSDMTFPNGSVLSPDSRTLIVAETLASRLSAFDVAGDGTLSNRRVFAQLDFKAADGICLDANGDVWIANALAPECLLVREGGEITARVETSQNAYACMLGGDGRTTLFVMTAPTSDRFVIANQRLARVEAARVDVPGAGLP